MYCQIFTCRPVYTIHDLVLFLLMGRRSTATFPFLHRSILPRFDLYPAALTAEEFAQLRRVLDVVHGAGEILRGYIIGAVNALLGGQNETKAACDAKRGRKEIHTGWRG